MGTDAEMEQEYMPVFLINGFLEAGKTKFLQFTMEQDYFQTEGKTLLIVCEDGEIEYDEGWLKETRTAAVYVESLKDLTPERMVEWELFYNPDRVLMEWNGMWNQEDLVLPDDWIIYQQITIIDASTFDIYAKNMKPLLAAMVRNSELVICNRCDGIEDLSSYRRTLKALNQTGDIIFEDSQGEIEEISEEDLPYDINAEVIEIGPEAYGIWYIDCMDRPERYVDKTVSFTGMVLKSPKFPRNNFVPGRMAMTCCEDDITFLGFMCKFRNARNLETKQWVKVKAVVKKEYCQDYNGEGPVLYADSVELAEPIKEVVTF